VGLPISVGIATTKVLAKVASAMAKPDGLLVVEPADELAFLHPLPVGRLGGVGPKTAAKLHERGISSVGDLARAGEPALISLLGRAAGRYLYAVAHNREFARCRSAADGGPSVPSAPWAAQEYRLTSSTPCSPRSWTASRAAQGVSPMA